VRVSAKADYAIRAAVELAAVGDGPVKGERVAQAQEIPLKFLENILAELRHAGLVRSQRGVEGGYWLARPPEEITLAEIVAAVDGPIVMDMAERDHQEGHCVLQDVWVEVSETMRELLEGYTLAHLVKRAVVGHTAAEHPGEGA
jgi:Rrf2 family protein